MLRVDEICVRHIIDATKKAISFTENRSRENIKSDEMLALSLIRLLEIVGEAAGQVSQDFKDQHSNIPWAKMIALRNRLIHGYFNINLDIVWDTVKNDLPPLLVALEKIFEDI